MVDFFSFNIILDDIVFPDGRTQMGVLGGSGPQAVFGMRVWSDSVGLIASAGRDLSAEALAWFNEAGIDLQALRRSEFPTPRAWQAMEVDGHRTQVWRVPPAAISDHLAQDVERIPAVLRAAKGYHYGIHPLDADFRFLGGLKATGALLSLEVFKSADRLPTAAELEQLVTASDIFSPNLEEARSLLGSLTPPELLAGLLDAGAQVVTLRMGGEGALVGRRGSRSAVHVPAVPVRAVDPIGAGNAFCGGFLAGWRQTGDLARAAAMGAVSASFLVEQVGLPRWTEQIRPQAAQRLTYALENTHVISIP